MTVVVRWLVGVLCIVFCAVFVSFCYFCQLVCLVAWRGRIRAVCCVFVILVDFRGFAVAGWNQCLSRVRIDCVPDIEGVIELQPRSTMGVRFWSLFYLSLPSVE